MGISDEFYQKFSHEINEEHYNNPIFSTEEKAESYTYKGFEFEERAKLSVPVPEYNPELWALWPKQQKYDDIYMKIRDRYNFENKWCEHWSPSDRRDYTPKQKRRIRKQTNKYRRRFLGEYF